MYYLITADEAATAVIGQMFDRLEEALASATVSVLKTKKRVYVWYIPYGKRPNEVMCIALIDPLGIPMTGKLLHKLPEMKDDRLLS